MSASRRGSETAAKVEGLVERQIEEQTQNETNKAVNEQLSQIEATYGAIPPGTEERCGRDPTPGGAGGSAPRRAA